MKELAIWLLPSFSVCQNKGEATCAMKPCGHKDPYSTVQLTLQLTPGTQNCGWLPRQVDITGSVTSSGHTA